MQTWLAVPQISSMGLHIQVLSETHLNKISTSWLFHSYAIASHILANYLFRLLYVFVLCKQCIVLYILYVPMMTCCILPN